MEFGILGQLQVGEVRLEAHLQRVLLAVLLSRANRVVPTTVLHDALWGDRPPKTPGKALQLYVHRLRKALGEPERIRHEPSGYILVVHPGELDADRFDALVAEAARRRADPAAARDLLRAALALWRGKPLGDLGDVPALAADVERLREKHLAACEECADVELELGRHAEIIGELTALVAEHPLRERLRARLMLALYRAGRQTEALAAYDSGRRVLAEEVGVDPGRELRELHAAMLRASPDLDAGSALPVPRQLPGDVAGFTGRAEALADLDRMLARGAPVVITAIAGTAGVGKTALAVHWACRAVDRFPDGQLYANLRGYAPGPPMQPIEVLAIFLRALGIPPEQVPTGVQEAAGLYRSLLAHRRMLVLLDNAAESDQVRPLIPGGVGSRVVITSRDRLTGLVAAQGAHRLTLDVLSPAEARTLVVRLLGGERVAAEPDAADELCRLCVCLPLAVRIAVAALLDRPERAIAGYVKELAEGNRLAALEVEGDEATAVRAAFDLSYATLPADAQRLFRLLGLVPGPDVDIDAAAALAGITPRHAGELLDRLVRAHLVDVEQGRYAFHDLLRLYARALCDDTEIEPAVQRLHRYYLHTTDAASRAVFPQMTRLPLPEPSTVEPPDPAAALAWLDDEQANLVAAVRHAAQHGPHSAAWLLADALRGYFFLRRHLTDWLAVADAGLLAARHGGGPREQAASHQHVGLVHTSQGHYARAVEDFTEAMRLSRQVGWVEGEAAAFGNLGNAYNELGRPERAVAHHERALALYVRLGRLGGQANAHVGLGNSYRETGKLDLALLNHERALALYRELGTGGGAGRALGAMGADLAELGRIDEALARFTESLELLREIGDRDGEATMLNGYASILCDAGEPEVALAHATSVLAIASDTGDRLTEAAALNTAAKALRLLGRYDEALRRQESALDLARRIEYGIGAVRALAGVAATRLELGDLDGSRAAAEEAVEAATVAGYRVFIGRALTVLARVYAKAGRLSEARATATQALALHDATGYRQGVAETTRLLTSL